MPGLAARTARRGRAEKSGVRCNGLSTAARGCGGSPRPGCRPEIPRAGFQSGISSSGMPMRRAVLRPRCWSGKKSTPAASGKCPIQHRLGVGRRADDAALAAAKRLQAGGRVDIRDRRHIGQVDHLGQLLPAVLDLFDCRHVGHRAAGGHVGQDHGRPPALAAGQLFRAVGQHVGRLGHEMHAAEGDRPALLVPAAACALSW